MRSGSASGGDPRHDETSIWTGAAMTTDSEAPDALRDLSELMDRAVLPPLGELDDAADRRRRRRRRWMLLVPALLLSVVLAASGGYVFWALTAPVADPEMTSAAPAVTVPPAAAIALPEEGAMALSVAGVDEYLGEGASGVWATSGSDDRRPLASVTKLITALVVLEARPLAGVGDEGPRITFGKADADLYDDYYVLGATIAPMPAGTTMTQREALEVMLVPSASNYAVALTRWAFGSQGSFVSAARRWLDAHGLTATTIVEPTGLDTRNLSTAADALALGKIAAADPVIAQISAMASANAPGAGTVYTTNDLLGTHGVTGLKTGTLGEGQSNLVFTASLQAGAAGPLQITGSLLGGSSRGAVDDDVAALLESIRAGFHDVVLADAGDEVGTLSTPWGSEARLVLADGATIFTWSDTPVTVAMDVHAPVRYEDGEVVGTVTWTAGPHSASSAVRVEGAITPPTGWWRLTHPTQLGG
jgi:serine-type D-Ala-D-Ala carboxypeptidase (penicillin-binding protein 5/6)